MYIKDIILKINLIMDFHVIHYLH